MAEGNAFDRVMTVRNFVIAVLLLVVGALALPPAYRAFWPAPKADAELSIVASHTASEKLGGAAVIETENEGDQEAFIRSVSLGDGAWSKLDDRGWGAGPPVFVVFTLDDWRAGENRFFRRFDVPKSVPAGEKTLIFVSILDPQRVGWIYTGRLEIEYDDGLVAVEEGTGALAVAEPPFADNTATLPTEAD